MLDADNMIFLFSNTVLPQAAMEVENDGKENSIDIFAVVDGTNCICE